MIERYIYAITKELPKDMRMETNAELRRMIAQRIRQMGSHLSEEEKIIQALIELGPPKVLANQFRGKERYLIGPEYFERYLFVLKIVWLSVFIGLTLVHGFSVLFSLNRVMDVIGGYIGSLLSALLQGTAWVTGIFALLEFNNVSLDTPLDEKPWHPSELPPVPKEKARISRGEAIFTIVFSTFFLTLFFFAPESIGIYYFMGDAVEFIPLFNLEALPLFRLFVFIAFTLNILIECIKILNGRWTRNLSIIITGLNILSTSVVIYAILKPNVWNAEMMSRFENLLSFPFEQLLSAIVLGIVIVTMIDSVSALYKGFKYGE